MFLDILFHAVVDVGKVIEGLYPGLVARITIPHPPSAEPIFRLGRLHQSLLNTDVTPARYQTIHDKSNKWTTLFSWAVKRSKISLYSGEVSSCFISWKYSHAPLAY